MKIKTITCHEVYNYGASLQEYALLYFLNQLGYQAEAIHYKPDYLSRHFYLWAVNNPKFNIPIIKQLYLLVKLPNRLKILPRKKAFDRFHEKYIPTGTVKYTTNEELINNLPDADVFICGSDQIWNSFFQNGKDLAFYLNFVPDEKKKIAYAASFAIDRLEEAVKPLVRENVSRLDVIGVRETSGVKILNELGIAKAVQVLDPVFLLEKEHWKSEFIHMIDEKYVFVYDFDSNPIVKKIALELKKQKGFKIYTINQNIDYADKNYYLEGPEKFLSLLYSSQFNVTNSFHALAFSIIFEKQFVVVNRSEKINTRMRDLLNLFKLNVRLVHSEEKFQELSSVEYSDIGEIKKELIKNAKQFLMNALS